jgi:hypothetical protein
MTGRQRDEFEASLMERRGKKQVVNTANVRAKLVARTVIDEAGKRLFTDGDVATLGEKSGAAIDRIYAVAARLSGISEEDVEDLVEGFGKADGGGSSSS